jgi:hypothetical protein
MAMMRAAAKGFVCCDETVKQRAKQPASRAGTYPNRRQVFLVVASR